MHFCAMCHVCVLMMPRDKPQAEPYGSSLSHVTTTVRCDFILCFSSTMPTSNVSGGKWLARRDILSDFFPGIPVVVVVVVVVV